MLSFLGLAWQIIYRMLNPHGPAGISTVIVLIFFFSGVQLMAISILGEELSKTREEAKHRPKYIRTSVRVGYQHLQRAQDIDRFLRSRAPLDPIA